MPSRRQNPTIPYYDVVFTRCETTMHYLILLHEAENGSARRPDARPAHLARLDELRQQGRLVLAGPLPKIDADDPGAAGYSGSAIVAQFDDLDTARIWAEADPYRAAGVTERVTVFPFKQVMP